MKKTIVAAVLTLLGSLYSQAQSVVTDPVGFVSVTVPTQSDAALGAPLGRANEYQGVIQSIGGVSGNVITVAGTPGWLTSQFIYVLGTQPKTYYARIDSGVREGLIATITANDTSSITITVPSGDDLVGVLTSAANTTGDSISIAPYWTLPTLLSAVPTGTQALLYPTNASGINIAGIIYTFNGTIWKQGSNDATDVFLPTYQGFTLRNNSIAPITISITGSVPMATSRMVLRTRDVSVSQDQRIFFNSPVPELLANVGFNLTPGDAVLIIDNSATGKNKAGSKITWNGSLWRQGTQDVTATFQLQPGTSYIFRKIQTANPGATVTSHLQSYLQ